MQELTPYALRELVKAVYVEVPNESSGKRQQGIHISYDLVGLYSSGRTDTTGTA